VVHKLKALVRRGGDEMKAHVFAAAVLIPALKSRGEVADRLTTLVLARRAVDELVVFAMRVEIGDVRHQQK